jgi:NAD-dependent deacetylase
MKSLDQQTRQAAELINQARYAVALTGAGISTPSGIPDFRHTNSGLWGNADPLAVASVFAFRRNPEPFYNWVRPLSGLLLNAQPNPAHLALAQLEKMGRLKAIITQNIDSLHRQAGSQVVYELHGHLRQVTCLRCYQAQDSAAILTRFINDGCIPQHHCGGVFKPNVILFGEQLPLSEYIPAQQAVKQADVLLVIGSSLEVAPAADLPELAWQNGAKLIIINLQPTHLDHRADLVIRADVVEALPQIVAEISAYTRGCKYGGILC